MIVTLTDSAASRIKEMMAEQNKENAFLRVGIKGGGCTGLSYGMGFDENVQADDEQFETHGIKVIVDSESAPALKGTKIDFKQNMMGGGFTIDNPNAIASCGCGSSFRTATNAGTPSTDC
ncbi:HesB/IscA family protein [Pueribacillus sp. YX66]|uniref:HesB/IscA family protein n=1 Tax=Pueribacillus sp. YX66 TaxID=3229242 RepID=UPI00358CFE6C